MAAFSYLPTAALDEIARRVGPLDNVSCSAVCRSWRRALKTTRHGKLRHPNRPQRIKICGASYSWRRKQNTVDLWSIRRDDACECSVGTTLGDMGTQVIGCSYGWTVVTFNMYEWRLGCVPPLSLLDPFTGRRLRLPPVPLSPRSSKQLKKEHKLDLNLRFQKAALVPGRRLGTFAAMLIHTDGQSDGRGLSSLAPGAKAWTTVSPPRPMPHRYVDVVFHKGAFYTLSCYGEVNAWAADGRGGLRTRRVMVPQPERPVWAALVESTARDELLMVVSRRWRDYEVFRYDEEEHCLIPVDDLGETAVLVGDTCSFCVSTRVAVRGPRKNCIYFTKHVSSHGFYYSHPVTEYRLPSVNEGPRVGEEVCTYGTTWFQPYVPPEFHHY